MNRIIPYFFIIVFLLPLGCTKDNQYLFDPSYNRDYLAGTAPIPISMRAGLEGIYYSEDDGNGLGNRFVLKWNQKKLSLFSNKDGRYAAMEAGIRWSDSAILLAGYWRSPVIEESGEIYLTLRKEDGALNIIQKTGNASLISGNNYLSGNGSRNIAMKFERKFSSKVLQDSGKFSIIAHRGGGRNSDNIPFAENSLKLIAQCSDMGANAIEIDVKLTKDNIPVIYHDDDINIRLTQKSPVLGNIEDYNWVFLKNLVKLKDGQSIPTLEEALDVAIDSTNINLIWLDNKGGNERFFNYTLPIMYKALQRAKQQGRRIQILNGIPTEEVAVEYAKIKTHKDRPSLCEISLARCKELNSEVYAPRWTLGTLDAEVSEAHALGMRVVTWTLDINSVIRTYLRLGHFDGILTNYPSILAYEFYTQE